MRTLTTSDIVNGSKTSMMTASTETLWYGYLPARRSTKFWYGELIFPFLFVRESNSIIVGGDTGIFIPREASILFIIGFRTQSSTV